MDSSLNKALRLVFQEGYEPRHHVAAYNHLNANILMTLYTLAHPERIRKLTDEERARMKQASIFEETQVTSPVEAQNLNFGINELTRTATRALFPDLEGSLNEEQTKSVAHKLVFGDLESQLYALLKDPKHNDYYKATEQLIEKGRQILQKKGTERQDIKVVLKKGGQIGVTYFKTPGYIHRQAGFESAPGSHIVIRESNQNDHRYIVLGVHSDHIGSCYLPDSFFEALKKTERQNWASQGGDVEALDRDLPGGRANAGGTSRRLNTRLTLDQILNLIEKHARLRSA